jgi:HK97 gp10 family phage protein
MARIDIKGMDEYALKLSELGQNTNVIAAKAVMVGANIVADEIKKGLEKNLQGSLYSEGDLLDSFGIAPPGIDNNGNTNTKIGFAGYDKKGVPNVIKARAMESGTSVQDKKPFVRPAVNRTKKKAIEEIGRVIDEETKLYAL